jgi:hypothetical protein
LSTIFHWRGPSIEERLSLAVVDVQSGLFGLSIAFKELNERIVHADVITSSMKMSKFKDKERETRDGILAIVDVQSGLFGLSIAFKELNE